MKNEYIRREDAVDTVPKERIVEYMDEFGAGYNSCRNDILRSIESLEPADVAPVVHSRWVLGGYDDMYYVCERCGHKQSEYYAKPTANFCPNCGAKMDGEE